MTRPGLAWAGFAALLACLAAACTRHSPEQAPPRARDADSLDASTPATSTPAVSTPAASTPAASAPAASAPAASARASAAAPATADAPPNVKVVTIGMHVGGGPYDEVTKEPMKRSVEPHFADLARCWKHVAEPKQADAGVDLVIEAAGGRASVSNPRATASGEGFKECVVAFFQGIDFEKPNHGKTVVSYSVRFYPRKP